MKLKGHADYRQEYDVNGALVIKSNRLEEYTKYLSKIYGETNSYLVVDQDSEPFLDKYEFEEFFITKMPIRDHENSIKKIFIKKIQLSNDKISKQVI